LQQAQMVLGYRTSILYGMEDYPALVLLNLVLGGDGQSRLFKHLREEEGLCYYAASHVEALSGLLFVVAAIESATYHRAKTIVERQIESLRRGYIENFEIESARSLLQARLLGIAEDREVFFRFQLREGLVGGGQLPEKLWRSVEQVGIDDLVRVANHLKADTAYLLHGGVGAKIAI
jgi:predicted Zn-dependent peptidase